MFLFYHFKDHQYIMFPEQQEFKDTLPKSFRTFKKHLHFSWLTEFKCEIFRYLPYIRHCTMKCLITVNPNGAAYFISDLFEGSISDVHIFNQCEILQQIYPGDAILFWQRVHYARFFTYKANNNIYSSFLGDAFTKEEEVILTKWIAKARKNVERFNEYLKRFRILDRVIPLNLCPIASQMVYVASCLVNFQECLCVWYWTRENALM